MVSTSVTGCSVQVQVLSFQGSRMCLNFGVQEEMAGENQQLADTLHDKEGKMRKMDRELSELRQVLAQREAPKPTPARHPHAAQTVEPYPDNVSLSLSLPPSLPLSLSLSLSLPPPSPPSLMYQREVVYPYIISLVHPV